MDDAPRRSSRRAFLRRGLVLGAAGALALGGYSVFIEPFWWKAVHLDLPVEGLPRALEGARVVQISDLHVGPRVDADYLARTVKALRGFDPDLVVVTGDVVHYTRPQDAEQAARVLENLPRAPFGTLAVLGNHDYGRGWTDAAASEDVVRRMTDVGVRVLRNEKTDVGGLQLVGLDDLWAGRFEPRRVLPGVDAARASLVLSHNPDAVDRGGWGDWRGWILSGHTHGGQCKPPFLPPPLLPVENKRYTRGAFDLGDGRRLYINAGLGWLRQVRFDVRPEVTIFTLRPA